MLFHCINCNRFSWKACSFPKDWPQIYLPPAVLWLSIFSEIQNLDKNHFLSTFHQKYMFFNCFCRIYLFLKICNNGSIRNMNLGVSLSLFFIILHTTNSESIIVSDINSKLYFSEHAGCWWSCNFTGISVNDDVDSRRFTWV